MIDTDLLATIDGVLGPLGSKPEPGEEFRTPALDVLRYHRRGVKLHAVPWLGRAWSVVVIARQPVDIGWRSGGGYPALIGRIARAAESRFPPGREGRWGTIGLTLVVLTPEPIGPDEDATLQKALAPVRRSRVVPLGLFRINLGQEALSFALTTTPAGLFPEPSALAEALAPQFRRFVPLIDFE